MMSTSIKQKLPIAAVLAAVLLLNASCNSQMGRELEDSPDSKTAIQSAEAFLKGFLDFEIDGNAEKVRELEHYENDWESELKYNEIMSKAPLISYEIQSSEKISDSIFAFQIEAMTPYSNASLTFYNFVVVLDGAYYAVCNSRNIPAELAKGINLSEFSNDSALSVDPGDVFGLS